MDSYTRTSDGTLVGGSSWFDETLTQITFHPHEILTDESKSAVLGWLNTYRTYAYLGRPASVGASLLPDKKVQLNFADQSAFESGFLVERRIEGGSYSQIGSAGPNQTQYVDADPSLQLFNTYYYRIRSYSGSRYSAYSAEVAIRVQPHLTSDVAAGLTTNGQRKLAQTNSGVGSTDLYMTYESGGGSFFTHYYVPTGTWDPEQPIGGIPSSGLSYRHPSLLLDSTGAGVYAVYEKVDASTNGVMVQLGRLNTDGLGGGTLLTLGTFPKDATHEATPVAVVTKSQTGTPSYLAASWGDGFSLAFGIGTWAPPGYSGYTWSAIDLYAGLGSPGLLNAKNPSIATEMRGASQQIRPNFYIVWQQDGASGGILLLHGDYENAPWPPDASRMTWEGNQVISVAMNSSTETNSNPSVTVDHDGNVFIAWEYSNSSTNQGSIQLQERAGNPVGSVISTSSLGTASGAASYPHSPSLTDYRYSGSKPNSLSMVWYSASGTIASQFDGSIWSCPYVVDPSGAQGNLQTTFNGSDDSRLIAYMASSGSPYAVKTITLPAPPPLLPAPQPNYPPNGATGMGTGYALLDWYPVSGAATYDVQVATDPDFTVDLRNYFNIPASNNYVYVYDIAYSTTYFWHVRTVNSCGPVGAWSSPEWFFRTMDPPPPPPPPPPCECCGFYAASADRFTLIDAKGYTQTIFALNSSVALPSSAPRVPTLPSLRAGVFDVRFARGSLLDTVYANKGTRTLSIGINGATYPLNIIWNIAAGNKASYVLNVPANQFRSTAPKGPLKGLGKGVIGSLDKGKLPITASASTPCDPYKTQRTSSGSDEHAATIPTDYSLSQNHPNPFNPSTRFDYSLPVDGQVALRILNVLGEEVATVVDEFEPAGYKSVEFDAGNLPSGVYYYRLQIKNFVAVKKMLLIR